MKAYVIAVALVLVTAGCSGQKQSHSTVSAGGPASILDYHVKYKSWSGVSPGAEFIHTILEFVELDLSKSRIRKFRESAGRPDPMLPYGDSAITKLIAQVPWIKLTPEQVNSFRESIHAWLNTNPPPEYNSPMTLGKEEVHVTRLTVSSGKKIHTTTLNPRGGYREDDPLNPPNEWRILLESLITIPKMPEGTLHPQPK
ncbi:hypothetical protein ACFLR4_01250 [Bacteroidota bacterium]